MRAADIATQAPEASARQRSWYADVVDFMDRQTPRERFETMVEAGLFTPEGKLAEAYRMQPSEDDTEP